MCICIAPRSCTECEGWTKEEREIKGLSIEDAREILSNYRKEVNRSASFGDSEVYFFNDENVKVFEGYLGSKYGGKDDGSFIKVNGEEFKGIVARAVINGHG